MIHPPFFMPDPQLVTSALKPTVSISKLSPVVMIESRRGVILWPGTSSPNQDVKDFADPETGPGRSGKRRAWVLGFVHLLIAGHLIIGGSRDAISPPSNLQRYVHSRKWSGECGLHLCGRHLVDRSTGPLVLRLGMSHGGARTCVAG